jgi:hypothetical protein
MPIGNPDLQKDFGTKSRTGILSACLKDVAESRAGRSIHNAFSVAKAVISAAATL